jgi:hypothetical protein
MVGAVVVEDSKKLYRSMTEEAIVTHMLFWAKSYREGQSNGQY